MQNIQRSYGGDQSDTLAQILGIDYDPQGHMAQMAQQMLSSGMGASTSLKVAAMNNAARQNEAFVNMQMNMNKERRQMNDLRNLAGQQLRGRQRGITETLSTYMGMLDPNDPYQAEEKKIMMGQLLGLQGAFSQPGSTAERAAMLDQMVNSELTAPDVAGGVMLGRERARYARALADAQAKKAQAASTSSAGREGPEEAETEAEEISLD
jgi:hypothetical protein